MLMTAFAGGWLFDNRGAIGVNWNNPSNVGSTNAGTYAIPSSNAATNWCMGVSSAPALGARPDRIVKMIQVDLYFGPTGTLFGAGRAMAVSLADGTDAIGTPQAFNVDEFDPGNVWLSWTLSPAGWGIVDELDDWIAAPSVAARQTAAGQGTPRLDAARVRLKYISTAQLCHAIRASRVARVLRA